MANANDMLEAVIAGDEARVRGLIAMDSSLANAAGPHGKTALHEAAERDHAGVARLLLDFGADIEALAGWGMTPLDWAASMGSTGVGELLLSRGARLNMWAAAGLGMTGVIGGWFNPEGSLKPSAGVRRAIENSDGTWTDRGPFESYGELVSDAFYVAARNGHIEAAKLLLERGAEIDFRGFFGGTGLHWAAINGHRAMVEFLIGCGADRTVKDERFDATPEGWALEGGHDGIAELLRSAV